MCGNVPTVCDNEPSGHEHEYEETVTKEATCTEEGEKTLTCACGDEKTETIPTKEHSFENGVCTVCKAVHEHKSEDIKDSVCTVCGALVQPSAHEHEYKVTETKATCTEDGVRTKTCSCGNTQTETIPATGHNFVNGVCTVCKASEQPSEHEHKYEETETKAATCTETGEKAWKCECGAIEKTETISAKGHQYNDSGKCTVCGDTKPSPSENN